MYLGDLEGGYVMWGDLCVNGVLYFGLDYVMGEEMDILTLIL